MAKERKKRFVTLEKIYGEAFSLYFRNIIDLMLPLIPVFLVMGVFFYRYMTYIADEAVYGNLSGGTMALYILFFFLMMFPVYPAIYMDIKIASNAYREQEESFRDIFREALRRILPFWGLHMLFALGTGVAMILLIVPGYIVMFGWSVFQVVFVVEKEKAAASLKRSWNLTKGNRGRIFLFGLMALMALYFFIIILSLIFGLIVAGVSGGFSRFAAPGSENTLYLVLTIMMMVFYAVLYPLFIAFITVLYYNLIKEKEGFETVQLADSFLVDRGAQYNP